jgi:hypothetical protein
VWFTLIAAVWVIVIASGLGVVWAYENRPGVGATPPLHWPAQTTLVSWTDRPTLILLAHPQCTCTTASLDELAEVLARAPQHPKTYVLFLRPSAFDAAWAKTDLWRRAAALPGAIVLRDDDGAEARRFGVATSGQTLLYDAAGALVFSGGITGSRGHVGANAGEASLVALLTRGPVERRETNVFGCSLFASAH